jgi:hypothetical protein
MPCVGYVIARNDCDCKKYMRKNARNSLNEIRRKHGSDGVWKHLVQGGLENIFSKKLSFLLSTTYGLQINFKGMI